MNGGGSIANQRSANNTRFNQKVRNFLASFSILSVVYLFYGFVPYFQNYFSTSHTIFGSTVTDWNILQIFWVAYLLLLAVFYFTEREPRISKSIYCLRALKKIALGPTTIFRGGLDAQERLGALTILLKAFFAPLMIAWLFGHTLGMVNNGGYVFQHITLLEMDFLAIFNSHLFWFLFQIILFLDVCFFTLGYLVELRLLKNEIRSVDPTLLGWSVALLCYPPFNYLSGKVLSWQPIDFPQFENAFVHVAMNCFLLLLMAIFTSASVALNFKASNLTHRGIISSGPYRFVRHPAYICKNLAWWIGAAPSFVASLHTSLWMAFLVLSSVAGWSMVYIFRALTEEDHLRSVDDEYEQYCRKVPYRFIPGVL